MNISYFCHAFAGARGKVHSVIADKYGAENITIFSEKASVDSARGDIEMAGNPNVHAWTKPLKPKVIQHILNHNILHLWCDLSEWAYQIARCGEPCIIHKYDVISMRGGYDPHEMELALLPNTWTIFINENHMEYMIAKYGMSHDRCRVVHNYPPLSWTPQIPNNPVKVPDSLVYFGGLVANHNTAVPYRYMFDVFRTLADAGISVHIYPASPPSAVITKKYNYPGMFLHTKVPHLQLHRELAKYEVGLVGYPTEYPNGISNKMLDYARRSLPNKATDYMFAGIPTLSINGGYMEKWVSKYGICVDTEGDLVDGFRACQSMAGRIDYEKWRKIYNMEQQSSIIFDLYDIVRRDV